jgi:indolepyruvate ferredoxin oxidoreductase beta subunit
MISTRTRILLVGVGGQGVLSAARILGEAARALAIPVLVGQLHGMSQRGGSVESTVVLGGGRTALIGRGQADLVLGFEPLEARRALGRISARTRVLMNLDRVSPYELSRQGLPYPDLEKLVRELSAVAGQVVTLDAAAIAREAGHARALGTALLGTLAGLGAAPLSATSLRDAVEAHTPAATREASRRAFLLGEAMGRDADQRARRGDRKRRAP